MFHKLRHAKLYLNLSSGIKNLCIVSGTEPCTFKTVDNVTVYSDSVILEGGNNLSEKYCQASPYNRSEANKSIE